MIEYGVAPGLWYFQHMYRNRVQAYVEKLVEKTKPKRVIINMLVSWETGTTYLPHDFTHSAPSLTRFHARSVFP